MKNFTNYMDFDRKEDFHFESKVVHGALGCEPLTGAVSFPIYQTATFRHRGLGQSTGFDYSRLQNPTRQELERTMAILENGKEGFAFSSGQAANMALFTILDPGDHVILSDDIYGGTYRIGEDIFGKYGIKFTYVDMADLDKVKACITPNTKMFFVETPTNPMMHIADIRKISEIAKSIGAYLVVDNTFLTPYFQRPLELGADIVVHSGTKYIGGHNDTIAGLVITNDNQTLIDHFRLQLKSHGNGLASLDSWLLIRGLKTLALRMEKHNENAKIVAEWLKKHPKMDLLVAGIGIAIAIAVAIYASVKSYPVDYDAQGKILVDGHKMAQDTFKAVGWASGFFAGWVLERRFVKFEDDVSLQLRAVRATVGLFCYYIVTLIINPLIKSVTPSGAGNVIRCFIQMFCVVFLFPLIFVLIEKRTEKNTAGSAKGNER